MSNTPSGFRDILPKEARQKEDMIQKIISVYRRYGFSPLETPIVEFTSTLIGDATDFNLFHVTSSRERKSGAARDMSLRFDLTVPLARTMVQYADLPKPFKRYQLGEVFRGEKPQRGRYRQFTQLDADVIGSESIYADIDVILMMYSVMQELGINKFKIRVNTRKILNALPELIGFDEALLPKALIALDKRDKITESELINLLSEVGLDSAQSAKLVEFGNVSGDRTFVLNWLKENFQDIQSAQEALSDLEKINAVLSVDKEKNNIIFDMSIIRGLAYYTGTIFETIIDDYPQYGSVYSGGRYDHLIEKLGGPSVPAIGASVGVDRLLAVLSEIENTQQQQKDGYIVIAHTATDEFLSYGLEIAEYLRSKNVVCDIFTGSQKSGKQFQYAESKNYQTAIILGEQEVNSRTLTLRDLETREQKTLNFEQFVESFKF